MNLATSLAVIVKLQGEILGTGAEESLMLFSLAIYRVEHQNLHLGTQNQRKLREIQRYGP